MEEVCFAGSNARRDQTDRRTVLTGKKCRILSADPETFDLTELRLITQACMKKEGESCQKILQS
jgi:hypothetical protein